MEFIQTEKGYFLTTEYTTGNKAWCAKIKGLHPKWKYDREFINQTHKGVKVTKLEEKDIIEEVIYSHSGKSKTSNYYQVYKGGLVSISEEEIQMMFQ